MLNYTICNLTLRNLTDEHPSNEVRIRQSISYLENEINNNKDELSPKEKAEIENQMKELKKRLNLAYDKSFLEKADWVLNKPFNFIKEKYSNTITRRNDPLETDI